MALDFGSLLIVQGTVVIQLRILRCRDAATSFFNLGDAVLEKVLLTTVAFELFELVTPMLIAAAYESMPPSRQALSDLNFPLLTLMVSCLEQLLFPIRERLNVH